MSPSSLVFKAQDVGCWIEYRRVKISFSRPRRIPLAHDAPNIILCNSTERAEHNCLQIRDGQTIEVMRTAHFWIPVVPGWHWELPIFVLILPTRRLGSIRAFNHARISVWVLFTQAVG